MHELRCNGPSVVAVPRQAKRHQQHSLHKVCLTLTLTLIMSEVDICFLVLTKILPRCGGAGHTTGDCMVSLCFSSLPEVSANEETDFAK